MERENELLSRLEAFDAKLQRIMSNRGGELTVGGQATAIAMLVTLNLTLFSEAASALARKGSSDE